VLQRVHQLALLHAVDLLRLLLLLHHPHLPLHHHLHRHHQRFLFVLHQQCVHHRHHHHLRQHVLHLLFVQWLRLQQLQCVVERPLLLVVVVDMEVTVVELQLHQPLSLVLLDLLEVWDLWGPWVHQELQEHLVLQG